MLGMMKIKAEQRIVVVDRKIVDQIMIIVVEQKFVVLTSYLYLLVLVDGDAD